MHLSKLHKVINEFEPTAVVIDPISNFIAAGTETETLSMLVRLVDFLKSRQITAVMTTLTSGSAALEDSGVGISSVVDTWLLVRDLEMHGERNRGIYVLKSRGMAHSNQVREFIISSNGIQLTDVYLGLNGVLTGSARAAQETRDHAEQAARAAANQQTKLQLERKRAALAAQVAALEAQFAAEVTEAELAMGLEIALDTQLANHRQRMAQRRFADQDASQGANSEGKERS
jgi:circadian clock protein KaiC